MPKKKKEVASPVASPPAIFEATFGSSGSVKKGKLITQAEAQSRRKIGQDVVVCGEDLSANRRLAPSAR